MVRIILNSCLLALLFVSVGDARGQHTLVIDYTNQPNALVFVDSIIVGRVSQAVFDISEQAERITIAPPVPGSWSIVPMEYAIDPTIDTLSVAVVFPYYYSVRSSPPGASVHLGTSGSNVGVTPLVFSVDDPLLDSLHLSLDGYLSSSFRPRADLWNHTNVDLKAAGVAIPGYLAVPPKRKRKWLDALALSLVAAGGITAVHYKFKADRRYKVYERTGDPDLRPGIRDLDLRSGIGLGVMQAGVTIMVVRLVRR